MTAKKQNVMLVVMSGALLVTYLVLVKALASDNTLRIILAAGGFLGFCGLYAALLVAKIKGAKA